MQTIQEAKQYLRENWEEGTSCPCCKQLVKLYAHSINSGSSRALIIMYRFDRENPGSWMHIQRHFASLKLNANSMNYILLKHWKLAEPMPNATDPTKNASGYWRITQKGRDFVEENVLIPSHAFVYNNKTYRYSNDGTDIRQSLGKKFNYEELMEGLL